MTTIATDDIGERQARLEQIVADLLAEAKRRGASAAEATAGTSAGLEARVRLGTVETLEHTRSNGLGITVYMGNRKGSAGTSDLDPAAVRDTVAAACTIASHTQEDPCAGLATPQRMATRIPDLDLFHPWDLQVEAAIDLALECEEAARVEDARIVNSEGAAVTSHAGVHVYGNSHGFIGGYPSSRHGLSCAVVGREGASMQRDYWWSSARCAGDLESAAAIGRRAGKRTIARLGARQIPTRKAPVLFDARVAAGLMRHLVHAVTGSSIYRRESFLLDHLGRKIFPDFVRIREEPLLPRGLGSAPFDDDGVATVPKDLVADGVLYSYLLDAYSACRLGMETTGNAGGVHNLRIEMGALGKDELIREMGTGLLVTELMGYGINPVTGDYSRGTAGFWVEGGEIRFPVEEVTIAGNLKQMFQGLLAVGNDCDFPGSTRTGSWLIDRMTIAGG
ncbi:metalloprotease PmbA [Candidatus Thiosymbion oneisti]|uniref:metalloprotease PmbA n=1 Tax=Candidatus Thiosymbion oneisti TaxID=589554 RepID=UPI000ACCDC7E|nr:metalloprotease PmbA [Candidatus Thiosymbion oneisti]